jgi:hypothetical protein
MTKIYWQGNEVDAYKINSTQNVEVSAGAGGAINDAAYARCGMKAGRNGVGELYSRPDWVAQNEIWHRFNHMTNISVGMVIWAAFTAAGVKVAQIYAVDANHFQYQAKVGGALADVGDPFSSVPSQAQLKTRFDIHHNGIAGGKVEVYYGAPGAQTKVLDATGDYSAAGAIVRVYHGANSVGGGYDTLVAHEIVQSTSTLSSTSEIKPPTSNGTDVDGTGTYADVDEQVYSDADQITLLAVGNHQSFKSAARTQTQDVVSGVTLSCRAWYEAGGPTSIKPYLTIGGVRRYGPAIALDVIALAYQYTFDVNPATGVAFTPAEANAATLEWGWEAAA